MARHQNSAEALVQFEATKSASGWASHKVRAINDCDGPDNEEEEQGTETMSKVRNDERPKCYRCSKPGHLQ